MSQILDLCVIIYVWCCISLLFFLSCYLDLRHLHVLPHYIPTRRSPALLHRRGHGRGGDPGALSATRRSPTLFAGAASAASPWLACRGMTRHQPIRINAARCCSEPACSTDAACACCCTRACCAARSNACSSRNESAAGVSTASCVFMCA